MVNVMDVVDRYVAVWNEPSADERHKRICSLWVPVRATCYRLIDARGFGVIEARVTSSWDKSCGTGDMFFAAVMRSATAAS